jgi:hypothetical protein
MELEFFAEAETPSGGLGATGAVGPSLPPQAAPIKASAQPSAPNDQRLSMEIPRKGSGLRTRQANPVSVCATSAIGHNQVTADAAATLQPRR